MSKELENQLEGLRRTKARKLKRLAKFTENREFRRKSTRCDCEDDFYCYCGSNTTGVINY